MDDEVFELKLPNLPLVVSNQIEDLLQVFKLPRSVIASQAEVNAAWRELPNIIEQIPIDNRDELIARMLIATSVGLFDGAINYIWNALILNLRNRLNRFGLTIISTILARDFDELKLNELRDSELIDLCYSLELLTKEAYFFINQCREVRNNFSSAHPNIAIIDNYELITFINRCCKYGFVEDRVIRGVNIGSLLSSLKSQKLEETQIDILSEYFHQTYYEQKSLLINMIHGIYVDPTQQEYTRLNIMDLSIKIADLFDDKIISDLVKQHNEYTLKQDQDRGILSRDFFFKMNLVSHLSEAEQISIVKKVVTALFNAHINMYNFYNEPPFAEKLFELSKSMNIPAIMRKEYILTVVLCYVGNRYGVSTAAVEFYESMIKNFTSRDIDIMLNLINEENILTENIKFSKNCRTRFQNAVSIINQKSVATYSLHQYELVSKGIFNLK